MQEKESVTSIDLYSIAAESRNSDANRFWNVFQVMSAINIGMITISIGKSNSLFDLLTVTIAGTALCYIWWAMQLRYALWCHWWDDKLEEIEKYYEKQASNSTSDCTQRLSILKDIHLFKERKIDFNTFPEIDKHFFSKYIFRDIRYLILPLISLKNIKKRLETESQPGLSTKTTPVIVAKLFFWGWIILGIVSYLLQTSTN